MLVVTELFNIGVNEMVSAHPKLFALCIWVLVITELVVSGTQCILGFTRKGITIEQRTRIHWDLVFQVFKDFSPVFVKRVDIFFHHDCG